MVQNIIGRSGSQNARVSEQRNARTPRTLPGRPRCRRKASSTRARLPGWADSLSVPIASKSHSAAAALAPP